MVDDRDPLEVLYDHLAATEERPVEPAASRWIGEAQAVAADARNAPDEVAEERVEQVRDLLANVEGTGDAEADRHIAAARELAERI